MANISAQLSPSRSPAEVAIDRVWRFFCSVRAAIAEITFLALLVLIGTLRGSSVPASLGNAVPFLQPLVDRWYAWDVFRSPVFAVILAVLAIAIAVCTINRVPGIWQTISHPRVRTSHGYLRSADTSATFTTTVTVDELAGTCESALRQKRFRVMTERSGTDVHVYADKNRYGKMGTFPFHLALILLLVGGIVGAQYGFRETEFIIPVGETRAVGNGTDLRVELVRFRDSYTPIGTAEEFMSEIVIYDGNEAVRHETISPNEPVSYRTATFYQTSFGHGSVIRVTDDSGRDVFNGTVDVGIFNVAGNPDAPAGFVEIPGQGLTMTVVAPDIEPFNAPELDTLNLKNGQMYVMLQPTAGSDAEREAFVIDQGQSVPMGNLTVTFEREVQWSLLQIAYNPGIPIFAIASFLLVGGLIATFYFPLRRIRAIVSPAPGGAKLVAVPLAKRDWSGKREFFRAVDAVESALGVRPEIKRPDTGKDWERLPAEPSTSDGTR